MDFMLDKITWLLNKFSSKVSVPSIPWSNMTTMMDKINPYLAKANILFPVDTLLTCIAIYFGIRGVLILIWSLAFIRKMLPF